MMDIVMHAQTKQAITSFIQSPSHALLLEAPDGLGKQTIAGLVADGLLKELTTGQRQAQVQFVEPEETGKTPIESIRAIRSSLRLASTGIGDIRRVIIITKAQTLTQEAQNALLKLLEEPPADVVFILLVSSAHGLLPTIRSRVRRIRITKPTKENTLRHFQDKGFGAEECNRMYLLSEGQPALMHSLLTSSDEHELASAIKTLKALLSSTPYERLIQINELSKSVSLELILNASEKIARAALIQAIEQKKRAALQRWVTFIAKLEHLQASLGANPQSKLVLTDLFLNI